MSSDKNEPVELRKHTANIMIGSIPIISVSRNVIDPMAGRLSDESFIKIEFRNNLTYCKYVQNSIC